MSKYVKAKMMELASILSNPITVMRDELEGIDKLANDIKKYQPERELEEIKDKVVQGYVIEQAVKNAMSDRIEKSDRIIYDLLFDKEYRIECKEIGKVTRGPRKGKPKRWLENTRERLATLNKYYMAVDYLVVGSWQQEGEKYTVTIHYIGKCYKFRDHFIDSKFDGPRYYNHEIAAQKGDAIVINDIQR